MQSARQQFDQLKSRLQQREQGVIAHEQAHQRAAGSLGSAPTYGYKSISMTMPDGSEEEFEYIDEGEVDITLPGMPSQLTKTPQSRKEIEAIRDQYHIVGQAALAPGSLGGGLSSADMAVAALAQQRQASLNQLLSLTDAAIAMPTTQRLFGGLSHQA